MADFNINQTQKTTQIQSQILSQKQIQALKLIGMGSQELRNEIFSKIEENPALEIEKDNFEDGVKIPTNIKSQVHTGTASSSGSLESDTYQQMIESSPDERETLHEHLIHQLNMINLSDKEYKLCEKLINNLDSNGYHILAPISLLDKNDKSQNKSFLEDCIFVVQQFDPTGICCKNTTESLLLQAELKRDASKLTLFILNNHLELINPPIPDKAYKKIIQYLEKSKSLSFQTNDNLINEKDFSLKKIEESIKYIKDLNPFPAINFSSDYSANYISPDVYVTHNIGFLDKENIDKGLIIDSENSYFRLIYSNEIIPVVKISKEFISDNIDEKKSNSNEMKFITKQKKEALNFIDSLDFREQSIIRACSYIVSYQKDFFRKGPGNLKPLTQKELANLLKIHESSISRMADSKFLNCEWGTFPIKYFFSNAVNKITKQKDKSSEISLNSSENDNTVSSDKIKYEIQLILKAQKEGEKRLSDQKISDLLAKKNLSVARRTVAKYRAQLNIESSYNRV